MKQETKAERELGRTLRLIYIAMFAAVLTVCSWITIPLPFTQIPITLGTLGAALCGAVLGKKDGAVSVLIYLLVGAAGIPVFHGFTGGLGILAGPTGGYLAGYVVLAFVTGWIGIRDGRTSFLRLALGNVLGTACCYALGTAYFMVVTGNGLAASLVMCVLPFLPGDAVKVLACSLVAPKIRSAAKIPSAGKTAA